MRRGITLYEVVLAVAIFAGAVAAISQGIATGARAALQSRLQSQAILLCESKMAELLAGSIPAQSVADAPFPLQPELDGWSWSVTVKPGPRTGLMAVEVLVACRRAGSSVDATFSMERLVRDQSAFVTNATATANANQATNAASSQQQQPAQSH